MTTMTEPDQVNWRLDEHRIEGGWFGGEFPRLWPPRCACGCRPLRWSPCVLPCCLGPGEDQP